ncbi:helix-turn-helix transcriptional regulator [Kribbella sp. NPDC026611]|uniref:helix-turn-helix domain-containing protein n=1 Tax=Kribbella sp. NPDC026611 TaxID=3154911 RepID=UPI0033FB186E
MTLIEEWTGRHANALRAALRLTAEEFAATLGISPRTITKWRERPEIVPSPHLQKALDTYLSQAPPDARIRFEAHLGVERRQVPIDDAVLTQLNTAIGDLARALALLQPADAERSAAP